MESTARTIAMVDDRRLDLNLVARGLTNSGYQVSTFDSAISFLQTLAAGPPDLLITDLQMPQMSGWELCHRLDHGALKRHYPIIVLTGLPETQHRTEALKFSDLELLEKPVSVRRLIEVIEELLTPKLANSAG